MSVVIGRWSANGRGCDAAGAGLRGGHGRCLEGAAVERTRLKGAARGPITPRGGRSLEHRLRQFIVLHLQGERQRKRKSR